MWFADPPTLTILVLVPSKHTLFRGRVLNVKCSTDANPDPHMYYILFNGIHIGNSSSGVFNTTAKADGVYTCVPINAVGTGNNATVNVTVVGELLWVNYTDAAIAQKQNHRTTISVITHERTIAIALTANQ